MGVINNALDNLKQAIEIAEQLKNLDLKTLLISTKEELLGAKEQNLNLREENRQLNEKLSRKEDLILDKHVYWQKGDSERLQPFCPACYSNNGKKVPMEPDLQDTKDTEFSCPVCRHRANPYNYQYVPKKSHVVHSRGSGLNMDTQF